MALPPSSYEEACAAYTAARMHLDACWEELWTVIEKVQAARKRAREAMDAAKAVNQRMALK